MTIKKTTKGYYEYWEKGAFVKHIGNAEKLVKWEKEPKEQSFIFLKFDALKEAGVIKFYRKEVKTIQLT